MFGTFWRAKAALVQMVEVGPAGTTEPRSGPVRVHARSIFSRLKDVARVGSEVPRVLRILPYVEWRRRRLGPRRLVDMFRAMGAQCEGDRNPQARARLRRAIRWVDALFVGSPNCYRRVLLEIALDPDAAREPVFVAVQARGGPRSGHAWLGPEKNTGMEYDAEFVLQVPRR